MKLKFRKRKSPLKIMTHGDQKPETKRVIPPYGVFGPTVVELASEPETEKPPVVICPLCLQPLSDDNTHNVIFNGKPTAVHKTCPR